MKVVEIIERYRDSFDSAIGFEEDDDEWFTISGLKEAITSLELEITSSQLEYLVWLLYQDTKDVTKLKNIKLGQVTNKNVSLSSIKEEGSSKGMISPENSPKKPHKAKFTNKNTSLKESKEDDYSAFEEEKDNNKDLDISEDDPDIKEKSSENSIKFNESEDQIDELNNLSKSSDKGSSSHSSTKIDSQLSSTPSPQKSPNKEEIVNIGKSPSHP